MESASTTQSSNEARGSRAERNSENPFPFVMARLRRSGKAYVLSIPPIVRKALGLLPGDFIGIRIVGKRAVINRINPLAVAPLSAEEARATATPGTQAK